MPSSAERLAAVVGRPLPADLLALMENYPPVLTTWLAKVGFGPNEAPLYPDLEEMLSANEEVRAEDIWTEEGPWPAGWLDLGTELGGDRFALALTEQAPSVHRLNTETATFARVARSLAEFVAGLERVARGEVDSLTKALPVLREG